MHRKIILPISMTISNSLYYSWNQRYQNKSVIYGASKFAEFQRKMGTYEEINQDTVLFRLRPWHAWLRISRMLHTWIQHFSAAKCLRQKFFFFTLFPPSPTLYENRIFFVTDAKNIDLHHCDRRIFAFFFHLEWPPRLWRAIPNGTASNQ